MCQKIGLHRRFWIWTPVIFILRNFSINIYGRWNIWYVLNLKCIMFSTLKCFPFQNLGCWDFLETFGSNLIIFSSLVNSPSESRLLDRLVKCLLGSPAVIVGRARHKSPFSPPAAGSPNINSSSRSSVRFFRISLPSGFKCFAWGFFSDSVDGGVEIAVAARHWLQWFRKSFGWCFGWRGRSKSWPCVEPRVVVPHGNCAFVTAIACQLCLVVVAAILVLIHGGGVTQPVL